MLVAASMEVYKNAVVDFLPTPSKSHYAFNLRDFSRVVHGILLVPSSRLNDCEKLIRLWIHESYRVFCDRLVNEEDRYVIWSKSALNILCNNIGVRKLLVLFYSVLLPA
jgi:dynein heavy chain